MKQATLYTLRATEVLVGPLSYMRLSMQLAERFRGKVEELEGRLAEEQTRVAAVLGAVSAFNALPWWRRALGGIRWLRVKDGGK